MLESCRNATVSTAILCQVTYVTNYGQNWHGWQTYQTDMGGKHTDMGGTYQTGMGGKSTKLAWMAKAPNKSQATLFRSSLVASEPRWPHPKELQFEANKHVICTDIQTEPSEACRWRHLHTMYTFWATSTFP